LGTAIFGRKAEGVRVRRVQKYAIAASEETRCSRDAPSQLPANVITYKKSLNARELQTQLRRLTEASD